MPERFQLSRFSNRAPSANPQRSSRLSPQSSQTQTTERSSAHCEDAFKPGTSSASQLCRDISKLSPNISHQQQAKTFTLTSMAAVLPGFVFKFWGFVNRVSDRVAAKSASFRSA